jgi:hypothetical protein
MRNKFYVVLAALGCFFTASPAAQPSQAALKIDPVRSTITYRLDVDKADEARIIFASSTHFEIKTETHHQD